MRPTLAFQIAFALLAVPGAASAQQSPGPACEGERHHEFDFWIGAWTVTNAAGATIGHNTIERVSGGCALLETWVATGGGDGRSLNFFDAATESWHQVWVGADGGILRLEGAADHAGRMILSGGPRTTPNGTVHDRITWTLRDDGTVEQLWEISTDDGATWEAGFRGIYTRAD